MKSSMRMLPRAGFTLVVFSGLLISHSSSRVVFISGWQWPTFEKTKNNTSEAWQEKRLVQVKKDILWRIKSKYKVAEEVLAGRLTLCEAALQFEHIQRGWDNESGFRATYPGKTDGEKLCRQVLQWVKRLASEKKIRVDDTLAQLEAEFKAGLACDVFSSLTREES